MARILRGTVVRDAIAADLKAKISCMPFVPTLAIIQLGAVPESTVYINQKKKFAERIGAHVSHVTLSAMVSEGELVRQIQSFNNDPIIHGIIVQMPVPRHLNKRTLIETIAPEKDVDGLSATNTKFLWDGEGDGFVPATARGVLSLLNYYKITVGGKHVVIVGRSTLVGKPIAALLLNRDATVTLCHRKTKKLSTLTRSADILIAAAGSPRLIGIKHVRKGQVVVDVGITSPQIEGKLQDEVAGELVGDVDFAPVEKIVKAISPVPGGVGPMTVSSLFQNLVEAAKQQTG